MRDVNGTGFELVLGHQDWAQWEGLSSTEGEEGPGRVVYDARAQRVRLRERHKSLQVRREDAEGTTLREEQRSSAARDRYGNWYWIDPEDRGRIRVRNSGDGTVETFWPPTEGSSFQRKRHREAPYRSDFHPLGEPPASSAIPTLGALTITRDHRLVAGLAAGGPDAHTPGLLAFDLHAGGAPRRIPLPGVQDFAPIDAAPRPEGGLYLLDRAAPTGESPGRIWAFDRALQVEGPARPAESGSVFHPAEESDHEEAQQKVRSSAGPFVIPAEHSDLDSWALLSLPDQTVLVLFEGRVVLEGEEQAVSTLLRYDLFPDREEEEPLELRGQVQLEEELANAGVESPEPEGQGFAAHDVAFLAGTPGPTASVEGTLYAVGGRGKQAFAFDLWGDETEVHVELRMDEIPLRRFSGKGLVAAGDHVFYDFGDRWLPLTARPRARFVSQGRIVSNTFDSERTACTWHRLFVDGCIPPGTTVRVESRAADRPDRLQAQPWEPEPELYRRATGSELPYPSPYDDSDPQREGSGTWELLFQGAEGRYVELRLTLEGDGRTSPRLYALRLYAPRFSYLDQYFPDVYQQDEKSAHFFERYLANVEGTFTALEGRIAHVETLFDTRTVPDEYLDWLGSWFGTDFDPALDDRRKRLFLDHAVELYNQRGTPRGLARMLSLALDPCADESLFTGEGVASAIGRPDEGGAQTARQFGVRIVEQFATRDVPRASVGDATAPEQPSEVRVETPWTPSDGKEILDRRFAQFLSRRYEDQEGPPREEVWSARPPFPPLLPSGSDLYASRKRRDWRIFTRRVIEGPYAEIEADSVVRSPSVDPDPVTRRFRDFLRRRYGRLEKLAEEWPEAPQAFDRILLPEGEVPTGTALEDWIDFVGLALPINRAAHRFRVLVPVEPEEAVSVQRDRLNVARRIAEREKPAHTDLEVLPYWAAFRVGTGRTGLDTILGAGSRYSDLLVGRDALGDHTVGGAHPADVTERRLVGRDQSDAPTPL